MVLTQLDQKMAVFTYRNPFTRWLLARVNSTCSTCCNLALKFPGLNRCIFNKFFRNAATLSHVRTLNIYKEDALAPRQLYNCKTLKNLDITNHWAVLASSLLALCCTHVATPLGGDKKRFFSMLQGSSWVWKHHIIPSLITANNQQIFAHVLAGICSLQPAVPKNYLQYNIFFKMFSMKSSKWFALECKNTALVCAKFVHGFNWN